MSHSEALESGQPDGRRTARAWNDALLLRAVALQELDSIGKLRFLSAILDMSGELKCGRRQASVAIGAEGSRRPLEAERSNAWLMSRATRQ